MIQTAVELGYIHAPKNMFIDIDMIKNYTSYLETLLCKNI